MARIGVVFEDVNGAFSLSDAIAIGPLPVPEPSGMALVLLGLLAFAKRHKTL